MIINKKNIVCFMNNNRVYFVYDGKLFWAIRKQGMPNSFGTKQNLRKRISVKDDSIHELGLVEETFLQGGKRRG